MGWTLEDSANNYPWRVGRKLGRTIYAQVGDEPDTDDPFLGIMETEGIAASVVAAVNHIREHGAPQSASSRGGDTGGTA